MAKRSQKSADIKRVQSKDMNALLYQITKGLIHQEQMKCMNVKYNAHNTRLIAICLCAFILCSGVYADEATRTFKSDEVRELIAAGAMYYAAGLEENAVDAYQRAIMLDPNNATAWNYLGIALRSLEQYDQAKAAYFLALNITPDDPEIWYNLGYAYGLSGEYEKEIEAYQEALRIQPDLALAWRNLAVAYLDMGDEEASLQALLKRAEYDPDSTLAWLDLGGAYERMGNLEAARMAFEKVVSIDESLVLVKDKIEEIDRLLNE